MEQNMKHWNKLNLEDQQKYIEEAKRILKNLYFLHKIEHKEVSFNNEDCSFENSAETTVELANNNPTIVGYTARRLYEMIENFK
jgi:hypothetical protein